MVSVTILQQERAEALESLRDTLADLDGSDTEVVREIERRARGGAGGQAGTEYLTAQFLAQIGAVLETQQARIAELEKASQASSKAKSTRSSKK